MVMLHLYRLDQEAIWIFGDRSHALKMKHRQLARLVRIGKKGEIVVATKGKGEGREPSSRLWLCSGSSGLGILRVLLLPCRVSERL